MYWFQWLSVFALSICLLSCAWHSYRIIRLGTPPEYAKRAGHIGKAVRYSFTGAMSPKVKESAYMHMPTYVAGIIYHIGTFAAIILFLLSLFNIWLHGWMMLAAASLMLAAGLSGLAILIKRMSKHELRTLSNPDDYISNILVTAFQLVTALVLTDAALALHTILSRPCSYCISPWENSSMRYTFLRPDITLVIFMARGAYGLRSTLKNRKWRSLQRIRSGKALRYSSEMWGVNCSLT